MVSVGMRYKRMDGVIIRMVDKKKVIFYGAGEQNLREPFDNIYATDEYEVAYICDKDCLKQGTIIYGVKVISPKELDEYDKLHFFYFVVITARNEKVVKSIRKDLKKLKNAIIMTFHEFFYVERIGEKKKRMALLYIPVTRHCNLNCVRCVYMCPLVKKPVNFNSNDYEKYLAKLHSIIGNTLQSIHLAGGEPLLNPEIERIVGISRKYFKSAEIILITNGILISKMPETLWRNCSENEITVSLSYYGLDLDYNYIAGLMKKFNVKFNIGNEEDYKRKIGKVMERYFPIDLTGLQDGKDSYRRCYTAIFNVLNPDGRIHFCCQSSVSDIFVNYFEKNIPVEYGIDIMEIKSKEELFEYLSHPGRLCDYCMPQEDSDPVPWSISKKEISEWVV